MRKAIETCFRWLFRYLYATRWGHKDGHQGFHPCESCFLCFLTWRRPEIGDRSEIGERQRIFSTVGEHSVLPCPDLFAVPDRLLLHMSATLRRRGMTVPRNSFTCCYIWHLRITLSTKLYRRVRRLGAPYLTICTRLQR